MVFKVLFYFCSIFFNFKVGTVPNKKKFQVEASQLMCNNYIAKILRKIVNQKTTNLLLVFQLDALALLRVIMTNMQENSRLYRLYGVICHTGVGKKLLYFSIMIPS